MKKIFDLFIIAFGFALLIISLANYSRQCTKQYIIENLKIEGIESTGSEYVNVKINIDDEVNNYLFKII